jgi:hypothetical protein
MNECFSQLSHFSKGLAKALGFEGEEEEAVCDLPP